MGSADITAEERKQITVEAYLVRDSGVIPNFTPPITALWIARTLCLMDGVQRDFSAFDSHRELYESLSLAELDYIKW